MVIGQAKAVKRDERLGRRKTVTQVEGRRSGASLLVCGESVVNGWRMPSSLLNTKPGRAWLQLSILDAAD